MSELIPDDIPKARYSSWQLYRQLFALQPINLWTATAFIPSPTTGRWAFPQPEQVGMPPPAV